MREQAKLAPESGERLGKSGPLLQLTGEAIDDFIEPGHIASPFRGYSHYPSESGLTWTKCARAGHYPDTFGKIEIKHAGDDAYHNQVWHGAALMPAA